MIMKTKQFISLAILCLMAMMLGSCAENKLKTFVNKQNAMCPYEWQRNEIRKIELKDSVVKFEVALNLFGNEFEDFKSGFTDGIRNFMLVTFLKMKVNEKDSTSRIILGDLLVEYKSCLQLNFTSKYAGGDLEVKYTNKEISDYFSYINLSDEEKLVKNIEDAQKDLPREIGKDIIQEQLLLSDKSVTYVLKVNEVVIKNQEEAKQVHKQNILSSYNWRGDRSLAAKTGRDMVFRFIGFESGKSFEVVIENKLLKESLN